MAGRIGAPPCAGPTGCSSRPVHHHPQIRPDGRIRIGDTHPAHPHCPGEPRMPTLIRIRRYLPWRGRSGTGVLLVGCGLAMAAAAATAAPAASALDAAATSGHSAVRSAPPPLRPLVVADQPVSISSPPVAVSIPAIGVTSTLEGLRVGGDGELQAPRDPARVGWYSDGPAPGDNGAAILAGHLDSTTAPAVFYNLAALAPGDAITVRRADGRALTFVVDHTAVFDRTAVPSGAVYSAQGPELHLITCSGTFDHHSSRYSRSLVVFARLARDDGATSSPPRVSGAARGAAPGVR